MQPWFRFYHEALTDRKIGEVCRLTGQSVAVVLGVWATILCLANDSPERGSLLIADGCPVTKEYLHGITGLGKDTFEAILEQFNALCMIVQDDGVYHVANWDKRQFSSDNSTERVRSHRARETLPKRFGNVQNQNQNRTELQSATKTVAQSKKTCPKEWQLALHELVGTPVGQASPGMRKRVSECGIVLSKDNGLESLQTFKSWWYETDWRGKQGQPPTPEQIRDNWSKALNGNGNKASTPSKVYR